MNPINYYVAIKKILVPHDLSPKSDRAFDAAIDLAIKYNAKLHVATWLPAATWLSYRLVPYEEFISLLKFKRLKTRAENSKVSVSFEYIQVKQMVYDVSTLIVHYVKNNNVDLVVMGTRGLKGLKKKILGSVSENVARDAPCKVIRVK